MEQYLVTICIIVITVIISMQGFNNPEVVGKLKHWPIAEKQNNEWYRFLTGGFVHGSWLHLIINMYVLYEFGRVVELYFKAAFGQMFGPMIYLLTYLLIIILADIPSYLKHKNNPGWASVGASGAVSGILFIVMFFDPWSWILLYFIIPIPFILAGILYLVYSAWAEKKASGKIDHSAHFYGAVLGILAVLILDNFTKWEFVKTFIAKLLEG
ncbi:MAG: rhomboid family intramembrane serine protease, partial [Bacteroidota bacterium]